MNENSTATGRGFNDSTFDFSVILPTCNRPEMCVDALRTLLDQSYTSYEIVIVDNSEDHRTADRLRQAEMLTTARVPVRYIREQRRGLVFARHTGAVISHGRYLAFADDDALFDSNWVEEIAHTFRVFANAVAVGTRIVISWDKSPDPRVYPYEPTLGFLDYGSEAICRANLFINGGSMAVRRDTLWAFSGFNPGQCGEYLLGDSETGLCRKLHRAGKLIAWTPKTTMHHRQFVDQHGSHADLCRRAWNNGIADAFDAWSQGRHLSELTRSVFALGMSSLSLIRSHWQRSELIYNHRISHSQHAARLLYFFRYRFDVVLRQRALVNDSQLDAKYIVNQIPEKLNDPWFAGTEGHFTNAPAS
jgi:glycosyltransferase involved in cell wall biosynthesis